MGIDDILSIARLYRSLYGEKRTPLLGEALAKKKPTEGELLQTEIWWFRDLEKGNPIASVAEADGEVVGMCNVKCNWPGSEVGHVGELDMTVRKDYRGIGIGKALMKDVMDRSKKKFTLIQTYVMTSNVPSKRLLDRFGFKIAGTIPRRLRRNGKYYPDYLMYKEL